MYQQLQQYAKKSQQKCKSLTIYAKQQKKIQKGNVLTNTAVSVTALSISNKLATPVQFKNTKHNTHKNYKQNYTKRCLEYIITGQNVKI